MMTEEERALNVRNIMADTDTPEGALRCSIFWMEYLAITLGCRPRNIVIGAMIDGEQHRYTLSDYINKFSAMVKVDDNDD